MFPRDFFQHGVRNLALLYIKDVPTQVPLKSISYDVEIIDSLAFISLHQIYQNSVFEHIEAEYFFSINPNACFYEFTLQVNERTIKTIIKEKEEAKEEFRLGLMQGRLCAFSKVDSFMKDVMQINIGNIPPKTEVKVKLSLIQPLDIYLNKFWKLFIPGVFSPRYKNEQLMMNCEELARKGKDYILPVPKYTWEVKISIKSSSEIVFAESTTHNMAVHYDKTRMTCSMEFKEKELPNKDFMLLYRNKQINEGFLTLEHLEEDTKYPYCAMVSLLPDFNPDDHEKTYAKYQKNPLENTFDVSILRSKAEFIVVLDRSGSMSGGRIEMAKDALIFFLKSLPPDSYFNICSFGTSFELLYASSMESNQKNIDWAIKKIESFTANFGGTEIYEPLRKCFEAKPLKFYPRTIFLITDGGVENGQNVIGLIAKYSKIHRTYSIGIGNGCSTHLIIESAAAGKGKHDFIQNLNDMNEKIIFLLQDAITPYLSDCEIEYDKEIIEITSPVPKVLMVFSEKSIKMEEANKKKESLPFF